MKYFGVLFIVAGAAIAQSWNSRTLPNVNGTFTPQAVNFAAKNWTLDDLSYAGYFLGTKSLGLAPCNVVPVTPTGDITSAVQAAITARARRAEGSFGFPAGTFTICWRRAVHFRQSPGSHIGE
jgi:hypothetical protein